MLRWSGRVKNKRESKRVNNVKQRSKCVYCILHVLHYRTHVSLVKKWKIINIYSYDWESSRTQLVVISWSFLTLATTDMHPGPIAPFSPLPRGPLLLTILRYTCGFSLSDTDGYAEWDTIKHRRKKGSSRNLHAVYFLMHMKWNPKHQYTPVVFFFFYVWTLVLFFLYLSASCRVLSICVRALCNSSLTLSRLSLSLPLASISSRSEYDRVLICAFSSALCWVKKQNHVI